MADKTIKELLALSERPTRKIDTAGWVEVELARRLRKLDERHGEAVVSGVIECACGRDRWCPDRRILDGKDE